MQVGKSSRNRCWSLYSFRTTVSAILTSVSLTCPRSLVFIKEARQQPTHTMATEEKHVPSMEVSPLLRGESSSVKYGGTFSDSEVSGAETDNDIEVGNVKDVLTQHRGKSDCLVECFPLFVHLYVCLLTYHFCALPYFHKPPTETQAPWVYLAALPLQ